MYNDYNAYGHNSTVLLDVTVGRPKTDVTIFFLLVIACHNHSLDNWVSLCREDDMQRHNPVYMAYTTYHSGRLVASRPPN